MSSLNSPRLIPAPPVITRGGTAVLTLEGWSGAPPLLISNYPGWVPRRLTGPVSQQMDHTEQFFFCAQGDEPTGHVGRCAVNVVEWVHEELWAHVLREHDSRDPPPGWLADIQRRYQQWQQDRSKATEPLPPWLVRAEEHHGSQITFDQELVRQRRSRDLILRFQKESQEERVTWGALVKRVHGRAADQEAILTTAFSNALRWGYRLVPSTEEAFRVWFWSAISNAIVQWYRDHEGRDGGKGAIVVPLGILDGFEPGESHGAFSRGVAGQEDEAGLVLLLTERLWRVWRAARGAAPRADLAALAREEMLEELALLEDDQPAVGRFLMEVLPSLDTTRNIQLHALLLGQERHYQRLEASLTQPSLELATSEQITPLLERLVGDLTAREGSEPDLSAQLSALLLATMRLVLAAEQARMKGHAQVDSLVKVVGLAQQAVDTWAAWSTARQQLACGHFFKLFLSRFHSLRALGRCWRRAVQLIDAGKEPASQEQLRIFAARLESCRPTVNLSRDGIRQALEESLGFWRAVLATETSEIPRAPAQLMVMGMQLALDSGERRARLEPRLALLDQMWTWAEVQGLALTEHAPLRDQITDLYSQSFTGSRTRDQLGRSSSPTVPTER